MTPSERERLVALERENRELTRTHRDSQDRVRVFRPGGTRPPEQVDAMVAYIDAHRERFGVESIGSALPIAPSTVSPSSPAAGRADAPTRCVLRFSACGTRPTRGYGPRNVWKRVPARGIPRRALHRGPPAARHRSAGRRAGARVDHDDPRGRRGRISSGCRTAPPSRPVAASCSSPS